MTDTADGFTPQRIAQRGGPTLEFEGRLLASTEWDARDGPMRLELWETRAGALIPVTRSSFADSRRDVVSAAVVEPVKPGAPIDNGDGSWRYGSEAEAEAARRFAVLDHFDWNDRARAMVREQLGWKLTRVVE